MGVVCGLAQLTCNQKIYTRDFLTTRKTLSLSINSEFETITKKFITFAIFDQPQIFYHYFEPNLIPYEKRNRKRQVTSRGVGFSHGL
jgi:hypothetical protein